MPDRLIAMAGLVIIVIAPISIILTDLFTGGQPGIHGDGLWQLWLLQLSLLVSIIKHIITIREPTMLNLTEDIQLFRLPLGLPLKTLPKETEKVEVNETTNNYYYGGAFYEKSDLGYTVVPATAGTIVPNLPEGGEEVKIGEVTYVQFGETYYQPIQVDGNDMYEIVEVKEE